MNARLLIRLSLISVLAPLVGSGCDSTSPPKTATVRGHILPGSKARPDTGTVQVSLFVAWDTTKGLATEASGGPPAHASAPIPQGSTEFTIENVTFGRYAAVAASWRDTTLSGQTATTVIGAWGADPQNGDNTPTAVTPTESQPEIELNIPVDYSRAKVATGPTGSVSGTLTISGAWPSAAVYLVALPLSSVGPAPSFPPMAQPLAMVGPVAQFTSTKSYVMPNVPHGQNYFIGAYTYPTFLFLGAYGVNTAGADNTPEPVTVGGTGKVDVTGIDFTIRQ